MPSLKKDLDPKAAGKIAGDFLKKTSDLYDRAELAGASVGRRRSSMTSTSLSSPRATTFQSGRRR